MTTMLLLTLMPNTIISMGISSTLIILKSVLKRKLTLQTSIDHWWPNILKTCALWFLCIAFESSFKYFSDDDPFDKIQIYEMLLNDFHFSRNLIPYNTKNDRTTFLICSEVFSEILMNEIQYIKSEVLSYISSTS